MQKQHIFKRAISFLLCFSFILSFGICGAYASDDYTPIQQISVFDLTYNATIHASESTSPPQNITYDVSKTLTTLSDGFRYVRYGIPKSYYQDGINFNLKFSSYGNIVIRPEHEYNVKLAFQQNYHITTNFDISVNIYNSNRSLYKSKPIYSELVPNMTSSRRDMDFNFILSKSDLPDGYYLEFVISINQDTTGKIVSNSSQAFYVSEYITITDLDDNSSWFQKIINAITSIPEKISNFFTNLGNIIGSFFSDLWNNLKTQFSNIGKWFSDLGDKIGQFFENLYNDIIEGLKRLFIPEDGFFEQKKTELEAFLSEHFGILWTAPDIIISTIRQLLTISPEEPTITMPAIQFTWEDKLVTLTDPITVHFNDYVGSGTPLYTFYQFYRTFVSIILIFSFLHFCISKYHYIFGKDGEAVEQ